VTVLASVGKTDLCFKEKMTSERRRQQEKERGDDEKLEVYREAFKASAARHNSKGLEKGKGALSKRGSRWKKTKIHMEREEKEKKK
jgi:hypothetical protein